VHRALLAELQLQTGYPSVTVLLNTTAGSVLSADELALIDRLIDSADDRLVGDVSDDVRRLVIAQLRANVAERRSQPSSQALLLCSSPSYRAAVPLGRAVQQRVIVDDTFATRDAVADLHRTASFRLVTVSERQVRLFVGDRNRMVEERSELWPMKRADEVSLATWYRSINHAVQTEHRTFTLPTVLAGVDRTVRQVRDAFGDYLLGVLPGNRDRAGWTELHHAAWPLVSDFLRLDATAAMQRLDAARSTKRFAAGLDEVWSLAREGRLELVVAEEHFMAAARTDGDVLRLANDPTSPDVVDDVVDDLIEMVMRHGGRAVFVDDDQLASVGRVAGVLRY
jgi:hypothetical protein